jgi:PEP-CTERM motif
VRVFPTSADGQHANSIPVAQNYGNANGVGMTRIGNFVYLARQQAGDVLRLNLDGTFNSTVVTGISTATGVYANPVTNKLYVSDCCSGTGIWEIDTTLNTKTQLIAGSFDGLSVSTDGGTIYGAIAGRIRGYSLATMTQVFDSGFIPGGVDGTELGAGTLAGEIFAWTNSGDLWEINLALPTTQRILVTGGARGDFVTADPNGSLLMVTTSEIWRLTAPLGGCIGAACENDVPEPGSLALVALGLLGLSRVIRRTLLPN